MMRRSTAWLHSVIPLALAAAAAIVFATGFYLALEGNVGKVAGEAEAEVETAVQPETLRVVMLGDSVARGVGDPSGGGIGDAIGRELERRGIEQQEVINLAVSGARTDDLAEQLAHANVEYIVSTADVVVVSIGGNDLFGEAAAAQRGALAVPSEEAVEGIVDRVTSIVEEIRVENQKGRIFVIGLYSPFVESPLDRLARVAVARWNAALIERFASDPRITVIPLADLIDRQSRLSPDRFHPSGEVYAIVGRRIAESM